MSGPGRGVGDAGGATDTADSSLVEGRCLREDRFRVPVLMYHHVEPAPLDPPPLHPDSYVTPEEFADHLDLLARRGFTTLTLAEAAKRHHAGEGVEPGLPRRPVVLTFDDGCRCFAEHALPALAERGMTATLFAVSTELGGTNRWDRTETASASGEETDQQEGREVAEAVDAETAPPGAERREDLLDAEALRRVAEAGMEVGSHSASHADLSRPLDEGALAAEVKASKADLEAALGRPVETFCYPYGRSSAAARAAVRRAGYLGAVSIHDHPGAVPGDPWAVPRMIVRPGEGRFELWLKARGWYPAWSRLPRLGILSAMRRRSDTP